MVATAEKIKSMVVQNVGEGRIVIHEKYVIRAIRGVAIAEDNPRPEHHDRYLLPGCLVELTEDYAKQLIKGFPRRIVPYGIPSLDKIKQDNLVGLNANQPVKDPNALDGA